MAKKDKKINYGLIGCGRIAPVHAAAILVDKKSKLKAVFDINRKKTIDFAKKYNCEAKGSLEELLSDPSIDVINVCTPHHTHKDIVLRIMKSGKYCICEKPLCLNKQEGEEIIKSKYYKDNVFVMFQNRFNPAIQFLKKIIKENVFGKILLCSVALRWWRDDSYFMDDWHGDKKKVGGMLFNQGSHVLDIMRRTCGEPKNVQKLEVALRDKMNIDDIYIGNIIFKNGILGNVEITTYAGYQDWEVSMFVVGKKGTLKIGGLSINNIEYIDVKDKNFMKIASQYCEKIKTGYGNSHPRVIAAFSKWLLGGKREEDLVSAKEGFLTTVFLEKLYGGK